MKNTLRIATVLTWFNMIIWGISVLGSLLMTIGMASVSMAAATVLLSAVPLHCYAGLQLYKSIRRPEIKLGSQTPVGIRFVGPVAGFFGLYGVLGSLTMIRQPNEVLDLFKQTMPWAKQITLSQMRAFGVWYLVLGLALTVNVFMNFRLLRWYYFTHQNDAANGNDAS